MFAVITAAAIGMFVLLSINPRDAVAKCTVCHSKNPKMVRMHEALEFKDCFKCHGRGRIADPEDMPRQMRTDPLCKNCHTRGPLPDPKELVKSPSAGRFPIP